MSMRKYYCILLLPIALLVLDRIAKWCAVTTWSTNPADLFILGRLSLLVNRAGPFTVPLPHVLLTVLTGALVVGFSILAIVAFRRNDVHRLFGSTFIVFGGASNLVDRFIYDGVIDYIDIPPFPVVNIADLMIIAGVIILIIHRRPTITPSTARH